MASKENFMKLKSKLSLKKRTRDREVQTVTETFGDQVAVLAQEVDVLRQLHEEVWMRGNGSISPDDLHDLHLVAERFHGLVNDITEEGVTPSQSKYDSNTLFSLHFSLIMMCHIIQTHVLILFLMFFYTFLYFQCRSIS